MRERREENGNAREHDEPSTPTGSHALSVAQPCAVTPTRGYLSAMIDAELGRRIERSLAGSAVAYATAHRALSPEHGADVLEVGGAGGGMAVWGSAFGAPNVSRAFALGMAGEVTAQDLARVEEFYATRGGVVRITTCPWTNASLFPLLAARGYRVERFDQILARPLGAAEDFTPARAAPSVSVARVPPGGAVAWGALVRQGFGGEPDDPRGATIDGVFEATESAALFVATVDGVRAGGAALDVQGTVGFLFATATLEAYRRRGVQAALIAARLSHARDRGAELVVVVTDPGSDSQRNLEENCAFRVGYTEVIFER